MRMNQEYSVNEAPIAEVRIPREEDQHHGQRPTAPMLGTTNSYSVSVSPNTSPKSDVQRITPAVATEISDGYPPRKNSDLRGYYHPNETDSYEDNSQLSSLQTSLPTITNRTQTGDTSQLYHVLNHSSRGIPTSPALERRLRDFRFAQKKRREKYGDERPWGILGLYDYLTGVRTDVEWAEDAAWRREHDEPYLSWADFDRSKDTGLNRPFFTWIFMIICTFFLILSIGLNGWKIEEPSVNPMIGPSASTLIRIGAKYTPLMFEENQWWRLVSPMVLHAGVIHYAVNMLAFWFIGKAIEQSHGFFVTAFLFIVPAFGGTILSALFLRQYISVGASGGIFGLIGACMADILGNWNLLFGKEVNQTDKGARFRHFRVLIWLLVDIIINGLIGLTPFIDNFTHMGGMIYGFLCGLSTLSYLSRTFFGVTTSLWVKTRVLIVRFFGIIVSLSLILFSFGFLLNGGENFKCGPCRYISCVPFPFWTARDNKWWYCDDCNLAVASVSRNYTSYTSAIDMTCPNNATVFFTLSYTPDDDNLRDNLPSLCRKNCPGNDVYYN